METATSTFQVKTLTKNEITSFKNLLPELIKDLTCNGHHKSMPQVNEHLSKVYIETNVISRGLVSTGAAPTILGLRKS